MIVLAGDVGGTKADLGLYAIEPGSPRPRLVRHRRFASAGHPGLEAIARALLDEGTERPEAAAFGIAGPVVDGQVRATNLPWVVQEDWLAARLGCRVRLLNDLEATAHGVPALGSNEILILSEGRELAGGTRAILAAGTGMGQGYMIHDPRLSRYVPAASEGGHCDYAPRSAIEMEMLAWLLNRHDHVSVERVISGMGIEEIHAFLASTGRFVAPGGRPGAAAIGAAAQTGSPPICVETMRIFVEGYGAEAGNLALKLMALGGVYIGGGIAPKILPLMTDGRFIDAFVDKGRFAPLMRRIPVRLILNEQTALIGAALAASYLAGGVGS